MLPQTLKPLLCALTAVLTLSILPAAQAATTTLLDLNFNDPTSSYPSFSHSPVTGVPNPLKPTTSNSGLFPTAPTSGYLALTPNASAVTPTSFYGGWAANTTLATVNSPYTAGGFGQNNLAKISLTARVRARGLPANGGVVILKLHAAGDNPNAVPSGYKRVMFEPILVNNGDWVTIGGTLDDAALRSATAQGTRYNFAGTVASPTPFMNAPNYTVLVEVSGFNRAGTADYVAYANNPTVPASGGRKNPGFDLTASNVRVEIDDVKLVVTDPATTGFLPSPTPTQLLRNANFDLGDGNWSFFEGAFMSTDGWGENGNANVAIIPGWDGLAYAGFMQNQIGFNQANGSFFNLTFRAKFEPNYFADQTLVTFMNGNDTANFKAVDINDQVAANLGEWATYTVRYNASSADLAAMNGLMSVKIQPLGRRVGAEQASALIDDLVLSQQSASVVGPQLTVKVAGVSYANGADATLFSPLLGNTTPYTIVVQNDGAETLNCPSVSLSGTSFAWSGGSSANLEPGESRTFTATAAPTDRTPLAGALTILSNDKNTADQVFSVNLSTTPVAMSDDFTSGTAESLGWIAIFDDSSTTFASNGSVTVDGGALRLEVDSQQGAGTHPWYYGAKKVFASPGSIDLSRSSIATALRAYGKFDGAADNKVQVYLESLSSSGAATGRVSLGQWVDETTAGSDPGVGSYFTPDGINDRVAILLPEGGNYTDVQSALSEAISQGFNPDASAFQIVVVMTDFEFDLGAGKIVELDAIGLNLVTKPFEVVNGGFEEDSTDFAAGATPAGWLQYPVEGVSKNLVVNGTLVYNASTGLEDANVPFEAYAGTKATKIYGQNFYVGDTWIGPSQTGVVYQEWPVDGTADMSPGQAIHARGAAKVFGIDLMTGGSTFNFGFRYMDAANVQVGTDEVTTITALTDVPDQWVALVANGTIPAGAAKVQLIAEFVQYNSTDTGAVYLDDLSVGPGQVPTTQDVGGTTYQLVWSDEFNGSSLNSANWTAEVGTGENGWGNGEAQYYTDRPENLRVENGHLVIEAIKENYGGSSWTSARIKTQDKRNFKYGKFEFRAKLSSGQGPWPAAWMLGSNISTVGWPQCGEIDVLEWRGTFGDANTVGHALHSPARHGGNPVEPADRTPVSNPSTEFHTYAVVWNSDSFIFSVDGVDVATLTPPAADAEVFRKEFFLLLNLAMGGVYNGGTIDPSLTGATYEVDYVRVYQDVLGNVETDTTPPVITLAGVNPVTVNWGSTYNDAGASAFDTGDNANVAVVPSNAVDTSVPGAQWVYYTATDSKGNVGNASRTVNVVMPNGGTDVGADGLTDITRYSFGGNGSDPLPRSLFPVHEMTTIGDTRYLKLTYYTRTDDNVDNTPMASTSLASSNDWTTDGVEVQVLSTVTINGATLEKRQATTPAAGSKKFLRLRTDFIE
jgi:beta-glucanase (GH16 family)